MRSTVKDTELKALKQLKQQHLAELGRAYADARQRGASAVNMTAERAQKQALMYGLC